MYRSLHLKKDIAELRKTQKNAVNVIMEQELFPLQEKGYTFEGFLV